MPNPTDPNAGGGPPDKENDHEHHKICSYHAAMCSTCPNIAGITPEYLKQLENQVRTARTVTAEPVNTFKRPTYKHTAKPPWIDFEKQRELLPNTDGEVTIDSPVRLAEKITTCRITFDDREPDRSDSGKAITIHQCEVHLVIITWDESND